jgi:hypothetical protein
LSALRAGHPFPAGRFMVLISVRGWVYPRVIVLLKGLGKLKKIHFIWSRTRFRGHAVALWLTLHAWTHEAIFSASLAELDSRLTAVLEFWNSAAVSQSRVRVTLRLAVYRQAVCLGAKPLRTTTSIFFNWTLGGYSPYVIFSLTCEWVCRLQLLLILASAVILRSKSILNWTHPNLEGQAPVYISLRNRVA